MGGEKVEELLSGESDAPSDGAAGLPRTLSVGQAVAAMGSVASYVRNCGGDGQSRVSVNAVVDGRSGRISSVAVTGPLAGTAQGYCISRAVRRAEFPRFAENAYRIQGHTYAVR